MLSVKIGPYHPFLEDAFVDTIRALKQDDPLTPLAVVVPTGAMMNYLQKRLVREQGASFINITFMNFYMLGAEVCRYSGADIGRLIPQSVLYECLIEGLLKDPLFRESLCKRVRSLRALARALLRVMQELTNANVCSEDMKRAIKEKFIEGADIQKLYGIACLYGMFRQKLATLKIYNYLDIYHLAAPCVSDSQFLKGFQHILTYGFYDLTGVELDFFREIFKFHPTMLFLPYQKRHAAFSYVKSFFESFVLGLAQDIEELPATDGPASPGTRDTHNSSEGAETSSFGFAGSTFGENCYIINTSGKRDEVWAVAKEILRLVDEGYKMEEIGVVARVLNPYREDMKNLFQENCIPCVTDLQEPLDRYPLMKTVRQILLLKRENYYRPMVMELLGSPYFKVPVPDAQKLVPRPDLWDVVSRRLGIRSGIECWLSRLKQAKSLFKEEDGRTEFADEEVKGHVHIPFNQISFLEQILQRVSHDLSTLPEKASWHSMSQKIAHFLQNHIGISFEGMGPEDVERDHMIMHKIMELFDIVQTLDCLNEEVTQDQFIDTFLDACRREGLLMGLENGRGVTVLDAPSARGISFRALFILGLNEKVFPRAISEDPFLRDHVRRRLSEVLGNYIPERLRGFDEDRLLFYLMANSARERLYLLCERSDEAGNPMAPSHYLTDIMQNVKGLPDILKDNREYPVPVVYVPRGIKDKLCKQEISSLAPKEISIRLALDKIDHTRFLRAFGLNTDIFTRSKVALDIIDAYHPYLTAYDGIIDDVSLWWNEQAHAGFSPTALEVFGSCPFKFFLAKVLNLESLDEPEKGMATAAADIGNLYHNILKDFYTGLIRKRYFDTKTSEINPEELIKSIAQSYFTSIEQHTPIPYPLIWELEKEGVLAFLRRFILWDLKHIEETGYIPAYLEGVVRVNPRDSLSRNIKKVVLKGKIDRIDLKLLENAVSFRVVDYKSGRFLKENIMRSAVRGQKLQLPFYIIMAEHMLSEEREQGHIPGDKIALEEASFTYIAQDIEDKKGQKDVPEKTIRGDEWKEYGEYCWDTIREFLHYIHKGVFPISPVVDSQKCDWCEFAGICRRSNQPLRFRLEHDARLRKYYEIGNRSTQRKSEKADN